MKDQTQPRQNHYAKSQGHDRRIPQQEGEIRAIVPSQTNIEAYREDSLNPELYRQALKVMLATPEIDSRLNYITAGFIATVFGGWLTGKMVRTRAFGFTIDLVLFFVCLVLAGFLLGVMLGEAILSIETVPILLLAAIGILLLIGGLALGHLIVGVTRNSKPRSERTFSGQDIVVPMRQGDYAGGADDRNGYFSPRSTDHA